jgi:hypothetical protein
MNQDDPLHRGHPGLVPVLLREIAGEEVAIGLVRADLLLDAHEGLELGLLDRLVEPRSLPLLPGLDFREDIFVGESLQSGCHGGLTLTLLGKIIEVIDVLEVMLPYLIDRLGHDLIPIRERYDAHRLWEIGVARRANQHAVRLVTRLKDARPEPGLPAVATAKGMHLGLGRLDHLTLGLALATNPYLGKVAACPAFVDPEVASAGRRSLMDEVIPVDIPDMPFTAGPHEADRDDRLRFLVVVDELALRQR